MSAAAAMAGAVINVQLIYIGTTQYLTDFRKPEPGTESLYYISNPVEIFGDLEIEKAFALFDKYNYSGARKKLKKLKESVPLRISDSSFPLYTILLWHMNIGMHLNFHRHMRRCML